MDGYARGGHAKYSLKVHLIFVTKYRKKLLSDAFTADLKQSIFRCCDKYGYSIIEMETDKDHIHILLEYSPKDSIADIAKNLKQQSTYYLWQLYGGYLSKHYWKRKVLWSDGYFACSVGQVSQAIIEKYIKQQG